MSYIIYLSTACKGREECPKKLLLHICCAPCATGVINKLKSDGGFDITGLYYNPNIHPSAENEARKNSVITLSKDENIRVLHDDLIMLDYWKENLEGDKDRRCRFCYSIRIDHVAKTAKEMGFDAFTTSLLISPWQDHEKYARLLKLYRKNMVSFFYTRISGLSTGKGKTKPGKGAIICRNTADAFFHTVNQITKRNRFITFDNESSRVSDEILN